MPRVAKPFMVRYPFDVLRAVSQVEPLTMNGTSYESIITVQIKTPQKEKQSAYASALLWSSPDTVIFPCGSLIFWIEPGPKRCTRIRELINVL